MRKFKAFIPINKPTDKSPSGARGHKCILPSLVAKEAIWTMIGCPLKDTHCGRRVGIITYASVIEDCLVISGMCRRLPEYRGLSWEINDAQISDLRAKVWYIKRIKEFLGVALVSTPATLGTLFLELE